MGFTFRKSLRLGKLARLNLSKSGPSLSTRLGKVVTVNSKGRVSIRLGKGLSWRTKL
jgi:hypothetical protein